MTQYKQPLVNGSRVLAVVVAGLMLAVWCGVSSVAAESVYVGGVVTNTLASQPVTQTLMVPVTGPAGTSEVAVTVACADMIRNGNFEASSPGRPWTGVANTPSVIYNSPFINTVRAHTGVQSGRVGSPNVNSYWNEMLQTVQLPAGVTSVTLNYWRFLDTRETSRTRVYDRFTIAVETEEGIQIVTPQQVNNTSSGRGAWVQGTLSLPGASAYSGKRLWVSFKGTTDSNLPSSLYVDDVQLIVCTAG
jgi:aminopeptidase S